MTRSKSQLTIVLGCAIDADKVLLARRFEPSIPELHEKWELPGGKIDFGENPATAVEREVLEETGYRVKAGEMLPFPYAAIRQTSAGLLHSLIFCFECKVASCNPERPEPSPKVGDVRWVPIFELDPVNIQTGSLQFLQFMLQRSHPNLASFSQSSLSFIKLESIDRGENRFRAYYLFVQARLGLPTVFRVQRIWGRLPQPANAEDLTFETRDQLIRYLEQACMQRRKHGYVLTEKSPNFPHLKNLVDFPTASRQPQGSLF
jgi:8-oxo-dGTP diphosphatase